MSILFEIISEFIEFIICLFVRKKRRKGINEIKATVTGEILQTLRELAAMVAVILIIAVFIALLL